MCRDWVPPTSWASATMRCNRGAALRRRHAEHGRQLRQQDVDRDAGEESGGHRDRQQIGDPAEAEETGNDQDGADHQGERGGERQVLGRRSREAEGRQDAALEDRRDGRVGAGREIAAAAEQREGDRGRHQDDQPELRREAAEPRGRHLLGNRDRREGEPGREIARQIFGAIAGERAQQWPGAMPCPRSNVIRAIRSCHQPAPVQSGAIAIASGKLTAGQTAACALAAPLTPRRGCRAASPSCRPRSERSHAPTPVVPFAL